MGGLPSFHAQTLDAAPDCWTWGTVDSKAKNRKEARCEMLPPTAARVARAGI